MTERPKVDDETQLVGRAKQGDEDAFATLVRAHQGIAHRVGYLITRSASDADDALQDGTVKAWYSLERFQVGRPFRPWFTAIVANEARNLARSGSRREALRLRAPVDGAGADPEDQVLAGERGEELLRHLDDLPEKLRLAVAVRHVLGLSERETAEALGVRPGTVKSRVSRGLAALRTSLGEEWT